MRSIRYRIVWKGAAPQRNDIHDKQGRGEGTMGEIEEEEGLRLRNWDASWLGLASRFEPN